MPCTVQLTVPVRFRHLDSVGQRVCRSNQPVRSRPARARLSPASWIVARSSPIALRTVSARPARRSSSSNHEGPPTNRTSIESSSARFLASARCFNVGIPNRPPATSNPASTVHPAARSPTMARGPRPRRAASPSMPVGVEADFDGFERLDGMREASAESGAGPQNPRSVGHPPDRGVHHPTTQAGKIDAAGGCRHGGEGVARHAGDGVDLE